MGIRCDSHENNNIPKTILKASKSLCRIDISSNSFSGFLIKFLRRKKDFYCLMMNGKIITQEYLEESNSIIFYYDNGKKSNKINLNPDERYIKDFSEDKIDATIIEILANDNIEKEFFLNPDMDYINDCYELLNEDITIIQNSSGKINYSDGKIIEINKYHLSYLAKEKQVSSGIPIFLTNSNRVIGIHKDINSNNFKYHLDYIGPIINFFKNFSEFRINLENGKYYIGNLRSDIPNGNGILYNKNKDMKYIGEFIDGKYGGKGKLIYDNGNYYIGQFINGIRHGKGIMYNNKNEIIFDGTFILGKPEGQGKYVNEDGGYYIGNFKNGLSHGKGILYYENGNIKYDGNFFEDKFEGHGKFIWENGNYYIGNWKNDLRHGKGILYNKKGGIKYEGNFIKGEFYGNGKYIFENGNYYVGKWKNNLRNGKGILYNKDGSIQYTGYYKKDKREGFGKYIYQNGEYYEGNWQNDLRNGKGILYSKEGNILFNGNYINDQRNES